MNWVKLCQHLSKWENIFQLYIYHKQHKENINFIKKCESFAIIADETQDSKCRSVLNILVSPAPNNIQIVENYKNKSYLIETIFLTSVDSNVIVREINKTINKYCLCSEKIIAFVSDNATYMIKAYETFKVLWEN